MQQTFRQRIMSASFWTAGGFAAQKAFQLGSNLVLTRLLFPEAFGLMALANVILIGLQMFSDVGIKPAIIQNERGDDETFLNTAWTMQIGRGFALWLCACVLAYPASLLYGSPILFPLICVLGATAAINGFASTSLATCERRLDVRRLTIIQLLGQAVTLTVTAALCWLLNSVWALAYGGVAGALVSTIFSFVLMPTHRHRLLWDSNSVGALARFGRWIFLSTAITFMGGQGLRGLQGVYLTPAELGIVTIAQTIAWMPGELTAQIMNLVGFPALSEMRQRNRQEFERALKEMRIKVLALSIPMFIGVALLSGPIINIMYDDRYAAAGHYLAILALGGAVSVIPMGYQTAVMALGDTRLHFWIITVSMFFRIGAMVAGFYLGSVEGMLVGIGAGAMAGYAYVGLCAKRLRIFDFKADLVALIVLAIATLATWQVYTKLPAFLI